MTREDFKEWLSYKSPDLADKFWACCAPTRHGWVIEKLKKKQEKKQINSEAGHE